MTITLAFLTPKLVQAAVEGRLPCGISITRLRDAPAEWFARDHIDKPSIAYWRETRSRRRPSGARRSRRACNRDLRCPAPPRAALAAGARREHRSQLRNHAEIDRSDGVRMVAQECPPGLRWRPSAPDHVFGNRRLGDRDSVGVWPRLWMTRALVATAREGDANRSSSRSLTSRSSMLFGPRRTRCPLDPCQQARERRPINYRANRIGD
jgi:hypothetical protein